MKKRITVLLAFLAGFNCGVVDTTDTGISSRIFNPDGTPAAAVKVSIFQSNDSTRTPVDVITTDNNGAYALSPAKAGTYNIWAEKGDLVAYQSSVNLSSNLKEIHKDTLESPLSFTAFAELQPNHDPRTVTVQVLGTYKYSNVEQGGGFTINGLAAGAYNLRLVSTLPEYTPTYKTIIVDKGTKNAQKDTIPLIYTGIPVVSGLKATYDTVNGIVNLQWNKTSYWDFQDYLVYRDPYEAVSLSSSPIVWRIDTVFSDTIFQAHPNTTVDTLARPVGDTNSYRLKYRVAIRNNAMEQGITYRFADVMVVPPILKKVRFNFKPSKTDTLVINPGDTLVEIGEFIGPVGATVVSVSWKDIKTGALIKTRAFTASQKTAYDTLRYFPSLSGFGAIECAVTDSKAAIWKDTVTYQAMGNSLPSDTSVFHRLYTIKGVSGEIKGYTVSVDTAVIIAAFFSYMLNPILKTVAWTDFEKDSAVSISRDSLYFDGDGYYHDSTFFKWSTMGAKRIGCTISDLWGRSLTDTIRVNVVH